MITTSDGKNALKTDLLQTVRRFIHDKEWIYKKITDKDSVFYAVPFQVNDNGNEFFFEILFIPTNQLNTINLVVDTSLIYKKEVIEYQDFHLAINTLNISTLYGNVFFTPYSEDDINIVFNYPIIVYNTEDLFSILDDVITYIEFFITEIDSNLNDFDMYKVTYEE